MCRLMNASCPREMLWKCLRKEEVGEEEDVIFPPGPHIVHAIGVTAAAREVPFLEHDDSVH